MPSMRQGAARRNRRRLKAPFMRPVAIEKRPRRPLSAYLALAYAIA